MIWDQENQRAKWELGDFVELRGPLNQVLNIGIVLVPADHTSPHVIVRNVKDEIEPWPYEATYLRT